MSPHSRDCIHAISWHANGSWVSRQNRKGNGWMRSGELLASDRTDVGNQSTDVWTYDLRPSSTKRLTFDPAIETSPVWSADGKQIVFASSRTYLFQIYLKNANGTEDEKLLPIATSDLTDKFPSDWSRDGKHILYGRGSELWVADYPGLEARPFVKGPAIRNGQFSPDTRWVAYASNENGRWEIYVTSFPDARGKWQISNSGGTQPRWRGDGKELFSLSSDGQLMAVPIVPGTNFDPGAPGPFSVLIHVRWWPLLNNGPTTSTKMASASSLTPKRRMLRYS